MMHMLLGVKHHVVFKNSLQVDSSNVVTCFNFHVQKPHITNEGFTFKGGKLGAKFVFLNNLHWLKLCHLVHPYPQAWGMFP
jgi:hypothetical protein